MALPTDIHPFQLAGAGKDYKVPYSLRLRASNTGYLSKTFTSAGNQTTWTLSIWIKRGVYVGNTSATERIFYCGNGSNSETTLYLTGTKLQLEYYNSGTNYYIRSAALLRDPSAWYHIVAQWNTTDGTSSNRMKLWINGTQVTTLDASAYPTQNLSGNVNAATEHLLGVRTGGSDYFDGYMSEINFIDGQALTASSFGETDKNGEWVPKKYTGTYGVNGFYLPFKNNSSSVSTNNLLTYSEQFDNGAWGKPAAPVAPTVTANAIAAPNGSTTADRIEFSGDTTHPVYQEISGQTITNGSYMTTSVYVKNYIAGSYNIQNFLSGYSNADGYTTVVFDSNGIMTSYSATGGSSANVTPRVYDVGNGWYRVVCMHVNTTGGTQTNCRLSIGQNNSGASGIYAWGAQINSGGQLLPMYIPTVGSTVSTQYYHIGADDSYGGSSWNNWLATNISLTSGATFDSMIDSPTSYDDGGNGRGNYPTYNPLNQYSMTVSGANLNATTTAAYAYIQTTFNLPSSGKYYFEFTDTSSTALSSKRAAVGFSLQGGRTTTTYFGQLATDWGYLGFNGGLNTNGGGAGYGNTWGQNDVVGVAIDCNTGKFWFSINNVWQGSGDPVAGTNQAATLSGSVSSYTPTIGNIANGAGYTCEGALNFGQRPFAYTPPAGFKALNSYNLANPTIPLVG